MNAMTMTRPQTITTAAGEELVVIPRADYDALVAAADTAGFDEDAADVAAFDAAMAAGTDPLPQPVSDRILRGDSRLTAWRKHRGYSQVQLADLASISQSYLSQLENNQRTGDADTLMRLAAALAIDVGLIA